MAGYCKYIYKKTPKCFTCTKKSKRGCKINLHRVNNSSFKKQIFAILLQTFVFYFYFLKEQQMYQL